MRMCVCFWPLSYTRLQYRQGLWPLISRVATSINSSTCIAISSRNHIVARTMIVVGMVIDAADRAHIPFKFSVSAKPNTKNQPCGAWAGQVFGFCETEHKEPTVRKTGGPSFRHNHVAWLRPKLHPASGLALQALRIQSQPDSHTSSTSRVAPSLRALKPCCTSATPVSSF